MIAVYIINMTVILVCMIYEIMMIAHTHTEHNKNECIDIYTFTSTEQPTVQAALERTSP